ncbi:N(4)-(beta-N-acetylglucosaminyl)-L-asparaginase [Crocinitomicaceae bacterium]|nr:N(4)-(beta-N-acetylglucosaminyl)-L-asparaginase [Crocinitomicaceae bacterium]MDC0272581.1 N(4)-(beta-N-acetylglucosaminyl)-L-asparaginase [Crocinitomicaceae bacterium]MDC0459573.1 N(4)-(beta-N-acetylglucosaminyl)-L-asparaginase [Crocinitomicaceae bacterium]MDC3309275.1 N(4)-(beta-N-acetylglucosaminyl)-L-asparaginase [Crocinitomicaceae bacterium]
MKRRTFFKFGLTTTALALLKSNWIFGKPIPKEEPKADLIKRSNIVISTWSHGIKANDEAWKVLSNGGKSIDAVEAGVRITEADITNRSVGIGGRPDREGHVTLDACIMDENSKCGAVACLEGIKHPISVARAVMDKTPHVMLVGEGARDFAIEQGFEKCKTPIKEVKKDWKEWKKENKELLRKPRINHENHDTIGMLALDEFGNISGSCTTSGWAYKMHGRVGDSPIIGAGLFIDNEIGGACATGMGEAIIRIAGSHTVVELMRQGKSPQDACRLAVERIISKHDDLTGLQCGFIALDVYGRVGSYSVYSGFNYAFQKEDGKNVMVDSEYNRSW